MGTPGRAILTQPDKEGKAIAALAAGATREEVGQMLGVHRVTVGRWANKDDIKAEIERQAQALLAAVPTAVELVTGSIEAGKRVIERERADDGRRSEDDYKQIEARRANDIKVASIGNDAAKTVLQTVGIAPSHMTSVVIGNLIIGDSDALSPVISQLLAGSFGQEIDVTPEEE